MLTVYLISAGQGVGGAQRDPRGRRAQSSASMRVGVELSVRTLIEIPCENGEVILIV